MQIELWSHIFMFVYISVIKMISFALLYFHSYSTSTYFHLVTLMAKCKLDRDDELFPVVEQNEEFDPNFETLVEKKEHSISNLWLCSEYCNDIRPLLLQMHIQESRLETMQFIIKSCEKMCSFLINVIHVRPAMIIDYKVVTSPTIANVKEGISLLSFYIGLIGKQINNLNCSKQQDNLFSILSTINANLFKLKNQLFQ